MKNVIFEEKILVAGKIIGELRIINHDGKYLDVFIKFGVLGWKRFFFGLPKEKGVLFARDERKGA